MYAKEGENLMLLEICRPMQKWALNIVLFNAANADGNGGRDNEKM